MYVPNFYSILRAIGLSRETYETSTTVAIPKEFFKFLVQVALENSEFNEGGYLAENPDVAEAVRSGDVGDCRAHYIGFGYFEGRTGGTPPVEEDWYLASYADVAKAVQLGAVNSAAEHYSVIGASEGRSPSAAYMEVAARWKRALANTAANKPLRRS